MPTVPTVNSGHAWAYKNAMLPAAFFMLAAAARGIATCPIEGMDERGVLAALNIPRRWSIPLVIAAGYPHATEEGRQPTPRRPVDELILWGPMPSPPEGEGAGPCRSA